MKTNIEDAKKRVAKLKKFYSHLSIYVIVNLILFGIKAYFLGYFESNVIDNDDLTHWISWNIISTPIIWGIFLAIHATKVFSSPLTKNWEERQIQKFMEKEENEISKF
ncbi:MAG: 2TM domain-containing protein [Flavobacteriaceae bacterium]